MEEIKIVILKKNANKTIKEFLKANNVGKAMIEQIRVLKTSFINGVYANIETILKENDLLSFKIDEQINFIIDDSKSLEIIYEDDYILAVNKPANLIIHPDDKTKSNTLVNMVANYYFKNNINRKIRYLHRIDKETTGIVLFAKDFLTEAILLKQFNEFKIKKIYLALVENNFKEKKGTIKANIGKDRHINNKMIVFKNGKEAITKYKVLKQFKGYSLVEFELITGKTHQIRVHSSYIKHPLLGDILYGGNYLLINRVALHSAKITFTHPITNKIITISSPLFNDMKKLIK